MSDKLVPDEQELLNHVPTDGTIIGNKSLRSLLGWDEEKYWAIRDPLVDKEILRLGRGKGGSVARVIETTSNVTPAAASESVGAEQGKAIHAEDALYDPLADVLKDKWCKELRLEEFIIQVTAKQGRRDTGGTWTRPDIVVVSVASYLNLPGKFVEVITFEVKTCEALDVTAVYEALSHLRAATRSYVVVSMSKVEQTLKETLITTVSDEANRHGVGFIIVPSDVNQYDEWEFIVDATAVQAVPSRLDDFLERQLSEENKRLLRKFIK